MPQVLTEDQVRRLRVRSQRLAGNRPRDVHAVVRSVFALQAQDTAAARLAVRPRSEGLTTEDVARACNVERTVVRTWAMRGTLHMVPAEDAGWLVGLLGPIFAAADSRRRLQLGLDADTCARALRAIRLILARQAPLTRAEIVRKLAGKGVTIDAKSQAPAHLLAYAAMQRLICRGPDRADDEPTYVLLEDWVNKQPEREPDAALAELVRRYIASHGPVDVPDFAHWAGIGIRQSRRAFQLIGSELEEVATRAGPAWILATAKPVRQKLDRVDGDPSVRLLPAFDAYLLGYRSRDLALPPRFARRIQAGGGWIHPTLVVEGRVIGTWRLRRASTRLTVSVEPFERLDVGILPYLRNESEDVGRFLKAAVTLVVETDTASPRSRRRRGLLEEA